MNTRIMFQSKFPEQNKFPKNHGKAWGPEEHTLLTNIFKSGANLPTIASQMGRKNSSILKRLCMLGLLHKDYGTGGIYEYVYFYAEPPDGPANNTSSISGVTLEGVDVAFMNEDAIIESLLRLNGKIRRLEECRNPPKIMLEKIRTLKDEFDRTVFYIDNKPKKEKEQ